jgi:octaprenyl-diphosphate synthase
VWLEKVFGSQADSVSLELAASLSRPGWDLVNRGGKRWRPLLMVLAAETFGGTSGGEAALPLVPLVEFSHNASLIHDDIEDSSDERRGKPAVHLLYGTDTAINGGTFLYFLSSACLSSAAGENLPLHNLVLKVWASHMRALHLGQAMDIAWHRDFHSLPGLAEYDRMCRLKTGCLARLAAVLGAYCSGPGIDGLKEAADIFGNAAEQLGVGFQILDDVKNLDTGIPGKKRGDDIVEGKKSLPVLLYLHRYPEKRDFAAYCFNAARASGTGAPEVETFIHALEEAGILEEAREKGLQYIRKSREIFSAPEAAGFPLKKEGRELLAGLVDSIS